MQKARMHKDADLRGGLRHEGPTPQTSARHVSRRAGRARPRAGPLVRFCCLCGTQGSGGGAEAFTGSPWGQQL